MSIPEQIASIYKTESRKVLATLVRLLGDLDLAEEALQEAFSAASEQWPRDGVPKNPRSWLVSTGRFKGVDALRRRARGDALVREFAAAKAETEVPSEPWDLVHDDQLRLVFTCCHPALSVDARVALCLREVCGLRTNEIARCFLIATETMKRRISRAKALLRDEQVPYEIPSGNQLKERLTAVLHVIYLVFTEGYTATSGDEHIRHELMQEALYLSRLIVELMPEPEAIGLLSLLLLHESRSQARVDAAGNIVPLEMQDRSLYNQDLITEAQVQLQRAVLSGSIGPYTIQAAIASVHATSPSVRATNWALIVDYYDALLLLQPGAVVQLQRAVAVAMRDGPAVGLKLVDDLVDSGKLESYHPAHAVRADLARRLGRLDVASAAYKKAIELARQGPERRYLQQQLEKISE